MTDSRTSGLPSLEELENNRNRFCGRWSVFGQVKEGESDVWRFSRLWCKRWNCPRCGEKRVKQLRRAIIEKATEHKLTRMLTLTLDHKTCTPEESLPYIRNCWNKFRTYLTRKHGKKIKFIAVVEPQKSGHAHLHILVDRFIKQKWISDNWSALGGGKIVHIKQVDVHRVGRYISKYLTKELLLSSYFSKYRRYSTSRDVKLFEKTEKGVWKLVVTSLDRIALVLETNILAKGVEEQTGRMEWFNSLVPL